MLTSEDGRRIPTENIRDIILIILRNNILRSSYVLGFPTPFPTPTMPRQGRTRSLSRDTKTSLAARKRLQSESPLRKSERFVNVTYLHIG